MTNNQSISLGAVTLNVNDLRKQTEFYQEVIGLHIIEESHQKVSLGIKETNTILVKLEQLEPLKQRQQEAGLYHLAFLLPTRSDLGGVLRHLIEIKAPIEGAANHGYSEALYLHDPEGNGIEIYRDKDRSEWDITSSGRIIGITEEMDVQGVLAARLTSLNKLPEGTVMGHVHLTGSDFLANETFYRDVLGFDLTDDLGGHARFFAKDGYHHQIGVNNWLGDTIRKRGEKSLGISQYEIIWYNVSDFVETKARLVESGQTIEEKSDNEFKIKDSNGIIIHMELKK